MSWSCSSAGHGSELRKLAVLLPYDVKEGFDGVNEKLGQLNFHFPSRRLYAV